MSFLRPQRAERGDALSAGFVNRVVDALVQRITVLGGTAKRSGQSIAIQIKDKSAFEPSQVFLAKITGNTEITANVRWKYSWEEIITTPNNGIQIASGGRTSKGQTEDQFSLAAWNVIEANNTTAIAIGGDGILSDPDDTSVDYPDGFKRRPVGGGGDDDTHQNDVIVMMWEMFDTNGLVAYRFQKDNSHDGSCVAPP